MDAVHLARGEAPAGGLLSDFCLHAVANVPGPHDLERKRLAGGWRWNKGTLKVYALAHQLRRDDRPRRQGWSHSCWRQYC